jgi:5-formyltetrahydrofolate cyclo-ligase
MRLETRIPGALSTQRELSLTWPVGRDTRRPPTYVGSWGRYSDGRGGSALDICFGPAVTTTPIADDPLTGEAGTGGAQAKTLIRKAILKERDSRDPVWRAQASLAIRDHAARLAAYLPAGPIAAYWPYKSEADPLPSLEALAGAAGAPMALPVIAHPHMRFLHYIPGGPMAEAGFGTLGPPHDAEEFRPATLLVPLAAFDAECQRIGWGKGHYDRAIERLHLDGLPLLTIGIAFSFQQTGRVPAEAHDRALNYIVTEERVFARKS